MKRPLLAFVLFAGLCAAAAQGQTAETPKLSITVTNQAAAPLFLNLSPGPGQMPSPRRPGSVPAPPAPMTNTVRRIAVRQTIPPSQSAQFDLDPGRYILNAMSEATGGPRPRPLGGIISVTNNETWIFKLEDQQPNVPSVRAQGWVMEIPARPGFRLSTFIGRPERVGNPLTQRTNFPPVQYHLVRSNGLAIPSAPELKRPDTNH